ncbi:MAG: hypothetical protein JWN87_244 [Frankiales bacterium]|jgi:hypothetical protein|nr:hypothetical protein [Frankiales bacterium]MCW2586114.1 hypothetical protein [Frankiales bacterium]
MTSPETGELVLPTFAVLARFRESAATSDAAVRSVAARLADRDEPFQEVLVERQEGPESWMVVARFVVVSIDAQTAVLGVSETLGGAGLAPDEVWMDRQVA